MRKTWAILIGVMLALSSLVALSPISMAQVAEKDQVKSCLPDTSVQNDYLKISVVDPPDSDMGRFTLGTTFGDPANPNDDFKCLLYGYDNPGTSFTTVRIDGNDLAYGSNSGVLVENPTNYNTYIKAVWIANNIQVTQVVSLVSNP